MKQIVRYTKILSGPVIGESAVIIPWNHPDTLLVTNGYPATTSPVRSINGQEFETRNTLYKPKDDLDKPGVVVQDKKVAA